MEDYIVPIFEKAAIITEIKSYIELIHKYDHIKFSNEWNENKDYFFAFIKDLFVTRPEMAFEINEIIKHACIEANEGNYVAFADYLEVILPFMYKEMEQYKGIKVEEGRWILFASKSGFISLENKETKLRILSAIDPMWEAYEHAKLIYKPNFMSFKIFGCELGYLPYQLYVLSGCSMDIYIYEKNKELVEYAFSFGPLSLINPAKLHIICEEDEVNLISAYCDDSDLGTKNEIGYFCHGWEISEFMEETRLIMLHFNVMNNTLARTGLQAQINYYRNKKNINHSFKDFPMSSKSKRCAVIAAGPSVDLQFEEIKNNRDKLFIISVNTIHKKLISKGIIPDVVTTLDPADITYNHFDGLEYQEVPLIMYSSANWHFSEYYTGPKYYIDEYVAPKEIPGIDMSRRLNNHRKSTVTALAMEVAIGLGAERIDLYGVDLAYPNGKSHAAGTMQYKEMDTTSMRMVPSVDGGEVPTLENMAVYIQGVSEIVLQHPDILFVNHSPNGAYIEGAKWYKEIEAEN